MLVLTRRVGEVIVLPGLDVAVQVISLIGGRVRLGIEAPANVVVLRQELVGPRPPPVEPPMLLPVV